MPLKTAFNDSASLIRVVVMLSPTWAYCLQGASATGQLLREINSQNVRVFVIWEPVLATDFVAPSTAALARIADARARSIGTENERCLTCSESTIAQPWCGTTSRYMRREWCGKTLPRSRFIPTIRSAMWLAERRSLSSAYWQAVTPLEHRLDTDRKYWWRKRTIPLWSRIFWNSAAAALAFPAARYVGREH